MQKKYERRTLEERKKAKEELRHITKEAVKKYGIFCFACQLWLDYTLSDKKKAKLKENFEGPKQKSKPA